MLKEHCVTPEFNVPSVTVTPSLNGFFMASHLNSFCSKIAT
jgi:hypothetical protein